MLDVHILTLPTSRAAWLSQCIDSVRVAAGRAGYPVHVHIVPGTPGHLGRSRADAYAAGRQPYVTHVDHDDYVMPDAFAVLADALHEGTEAVTTGEAHIYESGKHEDCPTARHHLAVFRRDALADGYEHFRYYPDQYLLSQVDAIHIAECVYVHRIDHDSASRIQRREHAAAADRELDLIRRPELFVAEAMTREQIEAIHADVLDQP